MTDRGVITINRRGVFSLGEAQQVLPVVRRITQDFSHKVEARMARLEALDPNQSELIEGLEDEINTLIQLWHEKIGKLGATPKGLWLVDFDTGDGYYCWKFPEPEIAYWHSYSDGFTGRVPVEERPEPQSTNSGENPLYQ